VSEKISKEEGSGICSYT